MMRIDADATRRCGGRVTLLPCTSSMPTRASSLVRALRALTAVITVWCTGCSAFEPVLNTMLGSSIVTMSCASAQRDTMPGVAMTAGDADGDGSSVGAAGEDGQSVDCACGSCHAVAISHQVVAQVAAPRPQGAHADLPSLVSAEPSAMRPPPNRVA